MLYKSIDEFVKVIDKKKRIIGLDFGEKKIGIALSDKTNLVAIPYSVYIKEVLGRIWVVYTIFL